MTARSSAFVVLTFAAVWLWVGTYTLAMPWRAIVAGAGVVGLAAVAWHVLRRPAGVGRAGRFHQGRFGIAVAFEVVAGLLTGWLLGQYGLIGYVWPAIGIIVALHFIGLWWASADRRFLALTVGMLAVNLVALMFRPGCAAMLAVSGLGSSAALATAMVRT